MTPGLKGRRFRGDPLPYASCSDCSRPAWLIGGKCYWCADLVPPPHPDEVLAARLATRVTADIVRDGLAKPRSG